MTSKNGSTTTESKTAPFEFFKNMFAGNGGQQQIVASEQPAPSKRTFHKREEDPDLEVIHKLEEKVSKLDGQIERTQREIATISVELDTTMKQYKKLANKETAQAIGLKNKATQAMSKRDICKKRSDALEQQRLTLSTQVENHRSVKEAEEMNRLMAESTIRMKASIQTLDIASAKTTASHARKAADSSQMISAFVFNPFDLNPTEQRESYMDEFNNYEVDASAEEEVILEKQPMGVVATTQSSNRTVLPSNALLDDDLF